VYPPPRKGCSTDVYGLAKRLCLDVGQVSLGMGSPQKASCFVQRCGSGRAGSGFNELVGEHRSPFPETRRERSASGKTTPLPKNRLLRCSQFSGKMAIVSSRSPRFAGTPARLLGGFRVFVVSSPSGALIRAARRRRAKSIRVNVQWGRESRPFGDMGREGWPGERLVTASFSQRLVNGR